MKTALNLYSEQLSFLCFLIFALCRSNAICFTCTTISTAFIIIPFALHSFLFTMTYLQRLKYQVFSSISQDDLADLHIKTYLTDLSEAGNDLIEPGFLLIGTYGLATTEYTQSYELAARHIRTLISQYPTHTALLTLTGGQGLNHRSIVPHTVALAIRRPARQYEYVQFNTFTHTPDTPIQMLHQARLLMDNLSPRGAQAALIAGDIPRSDQTKCYFNSWRFLATCLDGQDPFSVPPVRLYHNRANRYIQM